VVHNRDVNPSTQVCGVFDPIPSAWELGPKYLELGLRYIFLQFEEKVYGITKQNTKPQIFNDIENCPLEIASQTLKYYVSPNQSFQKFLFTILNFIVSSF
jgi:hypothetical protein